MAYTLDLGLHGVYAALAVGSVLSVMIGLRWMRRFLNPDKQHLADPRHAIDTEVDYLLNHTDNAVKERMKALIDAVLPLENMELHRVRNTAVGFYVGDRQLAHIHPSGHLDLPLPIELGEYLVGRGCVTHHRLHEDNGWYSHALQNEQDISEAQWLIRCPCPVSHQANGGGCRTTRAKLMEMGLCKFGDQCVATAAERWESNAA